jgi:hypothetical protein
MDTVAVPSRTRVAADATAVVVAKEAPQNGQVEASANTYRSQPSQTSIVKRYHAAFGLDNSLPSTTIGLPASTLAFGCARTSATAPASER